MDKASFEEAVRAQLPSRFYRVEVTERDGVPVCRGECHARGGGTIWVEVDMSPETTWAERCDAAFAYANAMYEETILQERRRKEATNQ